MKKVVLGIVLFIIGMIIGFSIGLIPKIRYDLNYNGKVDIADFLKYHNYYINH